MHLNFHNVIAPISCALALTACATAPEPAGPGNPLADSDPACANATITPEMRERLLAEYMARRAESAGRPRPPLPPATEARQLRDGAMPKHRCFVEVAQRGDIDLLFVGDSITDFFGRGDRGREVWREFYGDRKAANFGISGDTTQDVLWRMQNGELEGFSAKVIVLMLGTNNIGRNENADIAAGDAAIIDEFRVQQPQAKILLLGVFPRGEPGDAGRAAVAEINALLEMMADNEHVYYLDAGAALLKPDGTFKEGSMADGVHPATRGYDLWAEAMEPMLKTLLGER